LWYDWFMCGTWLIRVWEVTRSYVTWLIHVRDMTDLYVGRDSCICGTWFIPVYDTSMEGGRKRARTRANTKDRECGRVCLLCWRIYRGYVGHTRALSYIRECGRVCTGEHRCGRVCLLFIRIYRDYVGHTRALSSKESVEECIRESTSVEECVFFV